MTRQWKIAALVLLLAPAFGAIARDDGRSTAHPLGVRSEHLDPQFWIARLPAPDAVRLDAGAIAGLNDALRERDRSIHRLTDFGEPIAADVVRERIDRLSAPLPDPRFDANGRPLDDDTRAGLRASLALERIDDPVTPRFALVVRRTALRGYPTLAPLLRAPDDVDIDRLQESALFPGDAVVVLHASADGQWRFVVSERYAAWIEADALAVGPRETVLGYATRTPALHVIGADAHAVSSRENPALSGLRLEMGARLPWLADWPLDRPVNGQLPWSHHVVELPQRDASGGLVLAPALVARTADLRPEPLPYTAANLLRQAFRFLGERYGWGHDLHGRDCSGFVSEVYRSLGLLLPRNTGDQARSPVFDTRELHEAAAGQREAAVAAAEVGDLIHIPGHVMLVIGQLDGDTWVIHDAHRLRALAADGALRMLPVNGVVVTPLRPLRAADGSPLTAQVTDLQRIRPRPSGD